LDVQHIVVCGHTQCGAMTALLSDEAMEGCPGEMPHVQEWLKLATPVREVIRKNYSHLTDKHALTTAAAEENVLFAVETLHTYPPVAKRLEQGKLRLHAWVFKIATAELFAYDPEHKQFLPLVDPAVGKQ
jgi:carbonic anhydrase